MTVIVLCLFLYDAMRCAEVCDCVMPYSLSLGDLINPMTRLSLTLSLSVLLRMFMKVCIYAARYHKQHFMLKQRQ